MQIRRRNLISLIALSALFVGLFPWGARAADTASVTATVTVQNISVTVSDGTITYGTLGQNSTKNTCDLTDTQTATNNGNITEDLNIKAIADASTPDWAIGATAGSDIYTHKVSKATCPTFTATITLTTSYQELAQDIAESGDQTFDLEINTPNPSTVYTEQSVDVTVQAVAG
jgi:hypothetical protein